MIYIFVYTKCIKLMFYTLNVTQPHLQMTCLRYFKAKFLPPNSHQILFTFECDYYVCNTKRIQYKQQYYK